MVLSCSSYPFWLSRFRLAVLCWGSCHGCPFLAVSFQGYRSVAAVIELLLLLPSFHSPGFIVILIVKLWLSCSGCPAPAVLFWLAVLFWPSCPGCPVLAILFSLSCTCCPILTGLFCLSCSVCPALAALTWPSCSELSCLTILSFEYALTHSRRLLKTFGHRISSLGWGKAYSDISQDI